MKFYKLLTLFTFERIKKVLLFLFFVKMLGIPSFFIFFYSLFLNRESIMDRLSYILIAGAEEDDNIMAIFRVINGSIMLWLAFKSMMDLHLAFMSFCPNTVCADLVNNHVICFDTTIEEAVELIMNDQLEKARSYSYPWNKIYEFEIKNAGSLENWANVLKENAERYKNE